MLQDGDPLLNSKPSSSLAALEKGSLSSPNTPRRVPGSSRFQQGEEQVDEQQSAFPVGVPLPMVVEVGDRRVFLTDGILERNAAKVNAVELLTQTRELHAREAVQALTQAVVDACGGVLRDDATVLCVDWHGGPTGERDTSWGADQ